MVLERGDYQVVNAYGNLAVTLSLQTYTVQFKSAANLNSSTDTLHFEQTVGKGGHNTDQMSISYTDVDGMPIPMTLGSEKPNDGDPVLFGANNPTTVFDIYFIGQGLHAIYFHKGKKPGRALAIKYGSNVTGPTLVVIKPDPSNTKIWSWNLTKVEL